MPLSMHPEFVGHLDLEPDGSHPVPQRGDALALRALLDADYPSAHSMAEPSPDVRSADFTIPSTDGVPIMVRHYWHRDADAGGPGVLYVHGGGMLSGSVDAYDPIVRQYVQWTGIPFVAVDYRLAPEATESQPTRDAFAGLKWLVAHSEELGLDPSRIALMGDSAGGGIAAGAAILARDEGVPLAKQILIYPMLDDRTTSPDPELASLATWTYDHNFTGWSALLGSALGAADVSPYAVPARLTDFAGLPTAYIEVGTLDIFRDESVHYALGLLAAGVDCELHLHPGAPHGHDLTGTASEFGMRWKADRIRVLASL